MNNSTLVDENQPFARKTIHEKIVELFDGNCGRIIHIEYIQKYHIYKILVNTGINFTECKKIYKRRLEKKKDGIYEYNGYMFTPSTKLQTKLNNIDLKYISCYDYDNKLCIIAGVSENNIFSKLKRIIHHHQLPYEIKWKVTNITRYDRMQDVFYGYGNPIL